MLWLGHGKDGDSLGRGTLRWRTVELSMLRLGHGWDG